MKVYFVNTTQIWTIQIQVGGNSNSYLLTREGHPTLGDMPSSIIVDHFVNIETLEPITENDLLTLKLSKFCTLGDI